MAEGAGDWVGVTPGTPSRSNKVAPAPTASPEPLEIHDLSDAAASPSLNGKQGLQMTDTAAPAMAPIFPTRMSITKGVNPEINPLASIAENHVRVSRFVTKLKVHSQREPWYEPLPLGHDHHDNTWWNTPWHAVPKMRHAWGDPQYEVHPGAQELFLDLIFVGVAYRVGLILKIAFYNCVDGDAAMSSSATSGSSGSAGRRLAFGDAAEYECVGLGIGVLHAMAPFMCMYLLWRIETQHRAKYFVNSKIHSFLDILGNLLLVLAAMRMCPLQSYRTQPGADQPGVARVLIPILADKVLWLGRTAEVALLGGREAARRQSTAECISGFQVLCIWSASLALAIMDFGDDDKNASARDGAAGLMWFGNIWWALRSMMRTFITKRNDHSELTLERMMVCTNMGFIFHRNNEFMFLMLGETVLQIAIASTDEGDASSLWSDPQFEYTAAAGLVLATCMMFAFRQIVERKIAGYKRTNEQQHFLVKEEAQLAQRLEDEKRRKEQEEAKKKALERKAGRRASTRSKDKRKSITVMLLRRVTMQHEDEKKEGSPEAKRPPSPDEKAKAREEARKAKKAKMIDQRNAVDPAVERKAHRTLLSAMLQNEVGNFLWQTRAMTVMLVGVSVKLAIYNPEAETDAYFSLQQRLGLGVPMTISFAINLFESVFFQNRHHYFAASQIFKYPWHFVCLASRVGVMGTTIGICFSPLTPAVQLWVQASLAVVQCALLHVQDHKCAIDSHKMHPAAALPQALHALRQRAQRHREITTGVAPAVTSCTAH